MNYGKKETACVFEQTEIEENIYDCWITTPAAYEAKPGQFISVYPKNQATLLPRPISICEIDRENGRLRIVYRIAGKGTKEFSHYHSQDSISILGNLGNGFPVEAATGKKVFLIGGGIGIPPMLQLAKECKGEMKILLGYRDSRCFLADELRRYAEVYIASEDGSVGTKGNVMDAIRENHLEADVIFACGPMPMLRTIKKYAEEKKITAYISLEERMACGVGACLGCVCKSVHKDEHSQVNNKRVCTEGPVFDSKEVDI